MCVDEGLQMDIWTILGIEQTTDKRMIKRAYGRRTAQYHPEEYPEEFKSIHEAYVEALEYAEHVSVKSQTNEMNLFSTVERRDASISQVAYENEKLCLGKDKGLKKFAENEDLIHDYSQSDREEIDFATYVRTEKNEDDNRDDVYSSKVDEIDFSMLRYYDKRIMDAPQESKDKQEEFPYYHVEAKREKLRLKNENTIDFSVVESVSEEYITEDEKVEMLEGSRTLRGTRGNYLNQDDKKLSRWDVLVIVFFAISYVLVRLWKMSYFAPNETEITTTQYGIEQTDDTVTGNRDKQTLKTRALKRVLESEFESEFEVKEIEPPEDAMEVYYLVSEGKSTSDYQWFLAETDYQGVVFQFYVSWNEDEGYMHDYLYRQMFAIIQYSGLGGHVDDKDTYNMKYYEAGEDRYAYPVLLVQGNLDDTFYQRMQLCVESIRQCKDIFVQRDMVKLNFVNPNTGIMCTFKITQNTKDDSQSFEYMRGQVERLAAGTGY